MGPDQVLAAFRQVLIQFHVERNFEGIQKLDYSLIEWKRLLKALKLLKKAIKKQAKTSSKSKKRKQSSSSIDNSIVPPSKKSKFTTKAISYKESPTNIEQVPSSATKLSKENPSDKTSTDMSVQKPLRKKEKSKLSRESLDGKQVESKPLNKQSPNLSPTNEKETSIKEMPKSSAVSMVYNNEIVSSSVENDVQLQSDTSKQSREPYRRIKSDHVSYADSRLKDNSFLSKGGADFSYGYKAHKDLVNVRGKDFRHEKTKKKKGSYRGGMIDTSVHSIKFDE